MSKRTTFLTSAVSVVLVITASSACALDMEYYTYNGFDAVLGAFQKIVLIFSDNGYKALFFSVIVLGMLFGGMSVFAKAAMGARTSALAWAWPVGIGVILYLGLIIPKGNLIIYDPIKNRTQTVGNVPDGIVAIAGIMNKIERGLVDIVSTASDPMSFQDQAGGVGFDLLSNISSGGLSYDDQFLNQSLTNYIEECVLFELTRPGTTLTVQSMSKNTDIAAEFAKAASPAIYTVWYTQANPEGVTMECSTAWTANILPAINDPTKYDTITKSRCAESGFDPTVPAEYTRCKESMENTMLWIQTAAYTTTQIYRQFILTSFFNDIITSKSTDTAIAILTARNTGTSMLSSGVVANQWLPIMRAVVTAIAIGMVPFMVIFVPTPLFGKAIGIICGFFIWLTAWGVTDAVVHNFAIDYAHKTYDEIARYEFGIVSIATFSTASLKTMAAFGAIRWSGLMLATVITGMLVKFGGHALSTLAGNVTSPAQHAGSSAGMAVATPEGQGQTLSALERGPSEAIYARSLPFNRRVEAHAMETMGKARGGMGLIDELGEQGAVNAVAGQRMGMAARGAAFMGASERMGGFGRAVEAKTGGETRSLAEGKASGEMIDKVGVGNVVEAGAFKQEAGVRTTQEHKKIYGDAENQARTTTGPETVLKGMADRAGMTVDKLKRDMATMDVGRSVETMAKYANERGISFTQAAGELAESGGSQQYTGARAFQNTRGVLGEEGVTWYKTQEALNEAAKMDQVYQFANALIPGGVGREDFAKLYEYDKGHHAQESLTLTKDWADNLNGNLQKQGRQAVFQEGDRVAISRTQDGRFTVAKGDRGVLLHESDFRSSVKGWEERRVGKRTDDFGYRGEFGSKRTEYMENTFQGVIDMPGPDGKPVRMHGVVQKDANGNIVSTGLTNEQNSRVVTMARVNAGLDEKGKAKYENQWAVADVTRNQQGMPVLSNVRALSKREFAKNGYATSQMVDGNGVVIMETSQKGQNVLDVDKYVMDRASEFKGTLSGTVAGQGDKTQLSDRQVGAIMGMGAAERAYDIVGKMSKLVPERTGMNDPLHKQRSGKLSVSVISGGAAVIGGAATMGTGLFDEDDMASTAVKSMEFNAENEALRETVSKEDGGKRTAESKGAAGLSRNVSDKSGRITHDSTGKTDNESKLGTLYKTRNSYVEERIALYGPTGKVNRNAKERLEAHRAAGYHIYPDGNGIVNVVHPENKKIFNDVQNKINTEKRKMDQTGSNEISGVGIGEVSSPSSKAASHGKKQKVVPTDEQAANVKSESKSSQKLDGNAKLELRERTAGTEKVAGSPEIMASGTNRVIGSEHKKPVSIEKQSANKKTEPLEGSVGTQKQYNVQASATTVSSLKTRMSDKDRVKKPVEPDKTVSAHTNTTLTERQVATEKVASFRPPGVRTQSIPSEGKIAGKPSDVRAEKVLLEKQADTKPQERSVGVETERLVDPDKVVSAHADVTPTEEQTTEKKAGFSADTRASVNSDHQSRSTENPVELERAGSTHSDPGPTERPSADRKAGPDDKLANFKKTDVESSTLSQTSPRIPAEQQNTNKRTVLSNGNAVRSEDRSPGSSMETGSIETYSPKEIDGEPLTKQSGSLTEPVFLEDKEDSSAELLPKERIDIPNQNIGNRTITTDHTHSSVTGSEDNLTQNKDTENSISEKTAQTSPGGKNHTTRQNLNQPAFFPMDGQKVKTMPPLETDVVEKDGNFNLIAEREVSTEKRPETTIYPEGEPQSKQETNSVKMLSNGQDSWLRNSQVMDRRDKQDIARSEDSGSNYMRSNVAMSTQDTDGDKHKVEELREAVVSSVEHNNAMADGRTEEESSSTKDQRRSAIKDPVSHYMAKVRSEESDIMQSSREKITIPGENRSKDLFPGGPARKIEGIVPSDFNRKPASNRVDNISRANGYRKKDGKA